MTESKTMQALWLENNSLSFKQDVPLREIPEGEVLIRVLLTGICATDLELVKGYYPFTGVIGHEFVGVVVKSTDNPEWLGKRVVGEINVACHSCSECKAGRFTHCENRTVLGIINRNGSFAQYLSLPIENLHIVPENVSDEAAVFVEPLAAALEIQEQVPIHPSDRVLVIGAGRLGQLVAQTLALTGCQIQVIARHYKQKEILTQCGISIIDEEDVLLRKMDIVIEATGSPNGFDLARKAVRPRGTLVLKSTYKGDSQLNLSSIVVDEISLVGSRCGPFEPALRLLEQRKIDPTQMIMGKYPLSEGIHAMEQAARPGILKLLLQP